MNKKTITLLGLGFAGAVGFFVAGKSKQVRISVREPRDVSTREVLQARRQQIPSAAPQARSQTVADGHGVALEEKPVLLTDASVEAKRDDESVRRRSLRKGAIDAATEKFKMDGAEFRVVSRLRALPSKEFNSSDGDPVENKAGHVFFEVGAGAVPSDSARPVIYNERTRALAVLTGALSIKWSSPADGQAIGKDYGLTTVQSFDQIGFTYFQSTKSQASELLQLLAQLQKDKRVLEVSLHIVENSVSPQ